MIDEVLIITPRDINLGTNAIKIRTLKQGKDKKSRIPKEKFRSIPMNPDLRDIHMQYLLQNNIAKYSTNHLTSMKRQVIDLYLKEDPGQAWIQSSCTQFRAYFCC